MSLLINTSSSKTPRKPCTRCPHRLSHLWSHVNVPEAPQPGIQDSTTESSSSINAVKLKTTVEKEDLIDNAIPSYGCESSSTHGETNTSSETLVGDTVPDVHVESKSEDESKPNASRKCDEATESYDKVCTMSKIRGAPTPFNSPTFGTSKTSETNMEDVINNLNI